MSDTIGSDAATGSVAQYAAGTGRGRGRVLVVDDDAALAEMLSIVLGSEGFEPIWCSRGDEAVAVFHSSKPDLVLLDLMLPDATVSRSAARSGPSRWSRS